MCLGLVQDERRAVHGLQRVADDRRISDAVAQHLAHQLEENVDLDALVELASQACMPPVPEGHPAVSFEQEHRVRLAVARDAAFSMYYSEYVPNPLALQQTPGLSLYTLPLLPLGLWSFGAHAARMDLALAALSMTGMASIDPVD